MMMMVAVVVTIVRKMCLNGPMNGGTLIVLVLVVVFNLEVVEVAICWSGGIIGDSEKYGDGEVC